MAGGIKRMEEKRNIIKDKSSQGADLKKEIMPLSSCSEELTRAGLSPEEIKQLNGTLKAIIEDLIKNKLINKFL